MQPANCLNCDQPLAGGQKFCPECGQKTTLRRLSLHEIVHDAIHYFTHADKGIFHLLWSQVSKPGRAAREYVAGKRKKWFPPLNFLLIVAAIGLAVTGWVYHYRNPVNKTEPITQIQRPTGYDASRAVRAANVSKFFGKYYNVIPVISIPLLSFFIWLFYLRAGRNYTEHLVANMYIEGFALLVYALVVLPLTFRVSRNPLFIGYFLFELFYRSVSYYQFMDQRSAVGWIRSIVYNAVVIIAWGGFTNWFTRNYIDNGLWGILG